MRSASPFAFSLVLKFLRQRPSLDVIRSVIRSRWGLESQLVVSAMPKPRSVFLQFSNELVSRFVCSTGPRITLKKKNRQ